MLKMSLIFINALLVLFFSVTLIAADRKAGPVRKPVMHPVKRSQPITEVDTGLQVGFAFNERYSVQAEQQDNGTRTEYFTHEFIPTLKTTNYVFNATFDFYDYYKTTEASKWDNTQFDAALNNPWDTEYFKFTPMVIVIAPLFKKEAEVSFQYAAGGRLTAALKSKELDIPNFIFKYGWQVLKFGQKLKFQEDPKTGLPLLDAAGEKQFNTDFRLRQRFHLGYKLTEKLLAFMYFHYDSNFLFEGTVRNGFYHETFLEYAINENIAINLGTSNGGGVFVGDYQEKDNLKFYSKESSQYFAGLGVSF